MNFRFDFKKTLQASGVLLGLDGRRMGRVRLLKLLYIADRELLAETGRTITGDHAVAMKLGPVLSRTYDLIKGEEVRAKEWDRFVHSEGHAVVLGDDPGLSELSKREIEKLTEVSHRYREVDDWTLSEATHTFSEWAENFIEGTSRLIPWRDALKTQGKLDIAVIAEREEDERRSLDDLFASVSSQ